MNSETKSKSLPHSKTRSHANKTGDDAAREDLYHRIYRVVCQIPSGYVTTYGAVAAAVGIRSGARVVGYALNQLVLSPEALNSIPAHRVVNRLGQLTGRGYFPGNSMLEALESEGVTFVEPYCVDLKKHYWEPILQKS